MSDTNEDAAEEHRLLDLGGKISDGDGVDWEAEERETPELAPDLRRLAQLEAIARVCASASGVSPEIARRSAALHGDEVFRPEAVRSCPFEWGPLVVLEHVGSGSFGDVYRAFEPRLQREVALKLRRETQTSAATSARRFLEEARALARVRHPNVVAVHGADVQGEQVGFWTDYVPGTTLAAYLAENGPLDVAEATSIVRDVCRALAAVHAAGIVHGDVKASNVMRDRGGRILLMDFGAASWLSSDEESSGVSMVVGSPLAMAPELLAGEPASASSDLYALGVLFHQLLTGTYPYVAGDIGALAEKIERGERPAISTLRPDVPERVLAALERALAREPGQRAASAVAMEESLRAAIEGPLVRRDNLPRELDAFFGREPELAAIDRRLSAGSRLVTLVGTAGTGKTRVALRYASTIGKAVVSGAWFCDFTGAKGSDGIASVIGAALDVPLARGDAITQLGHAIAARSPCLMILDNLEHLIDSAREIVPRLVALAPGARFLATSRERLNVRGEETVLVEPLPLEAGNALFVDRACSQRPGLALESPNEAAAIREIVDLLEGIPLAIELAAARMRVMSPVQLRERIHDRFRVLTGGAQDRHATLRAAIDASWDLLQPWERAAFMQCSVFEGGFTLEAAEFVIDLRETFDAPWTADVVQSLVDKSLLRVLDDQSAAEGDPPRFAMFASLRDYAREKLEAGRGHDASLRETADRHRSWYARWAGDESRVALRGDGSERKRRQLAREVGNLEVALRNAVHDGDAVAAVSLYRAAWTVFGTRGPLGAGITLGRVVLRLPLSEAQRAAVLMNLGQAEWYVGKLEIAQGHLEEALAIARASADRRLEGSALSSLGGLCLQRGRMEEARVALDAALAIAREGGDLPSEAIVLGTLGTLHRDAGRFDDALVSYEAALGLARATANRSLEGTILGNLGLLRHDHGSLEAARDDYDAALRIHRAVGNRRFEAIILGNLGNLHYHHGDFDEARESYGAALELARAAGNRPFEGVVLANLAELLRDQGLLDEALAHCEASLVVVREVGLRRIEGAVLGNYAFLLLEQGHTEGARAAVSEGESILRQTGDGSELCKLLCTRAEIEHAAGDAAAARDTLSEIETRVMDLGPRLGPDLERSLSKLRATLSGS